MISDKVIGSVESINFFAGKGVIALYSQVQQLIAYGPAVDIFRPEMPAGDSNRLAPFSIIAQKLMCMGFNDTQEDTIVQDLPWRYCGSNLLAGAVKMECVVDEDYPCFQTLPKPSEAL